MIRKLVVSAALLAGCSLAAQQVAAQTATVTVTGTVLSGYDATGAFGTASSDLAGRPFSAIFTVTPKAGATVIDTGSLSYLFGTYGASPVTAALTIGTGTHQFGGTLSGSAKAINGLNPFTLGLDALYYSSDDVDLTRPIPAASMMYVGFETLRDLLSSANYMSYSTINLTDADHAQGGVQIANYNSAGQLGATTYATLSLSTIGAKLAAPVPEPATWAMMIVGFGVAGVAMRRQRTRARIAFA